MIGSKKGISFVSSKAIICKICFVAAVFAHERVVFTHEKVAKRPEIIKIKQLATSHIRFCVLDMKSF
jgi:hypothetical protein